jgi:hypothetical protein
MERDNSVPNVQRLIGEVASRHGILLKPDDAAFALVTINELVLEKVMSELLIKVRDAVTDFEHAAVRVQAKAGSLLASEVKNAAEAIHCELKDDVAAAGKQAQQFVVEVHRAHSRAAIEKWLALGLICALILFISGVVVGRILR